MFDDWEVLQNEYDELLLKEPKTPADLRRLDEIEAAILHEYGPQWFEITGKQ